MSQKIAVRCEYNSFTVPLCQLAFLRNWLQLINCFATDWSLFNPDTLWFTNSLYFLRVILRRQVQADHPVNVVRFLGHYFRLSSGRVLSTAETVATNLQNPSRVCFPSQFMTAVDHPTPIVQSKTDHRPDSVLPNTFVPFGSVCWRLTVHF